MKKFYRCKICGSEFCLKGKRYCEEGGVMLCNGNAALGGKNAHKEIEMDYAGETIEALRQLRKQRK